MEGRKTGLKRMQQAKIQRQNEENIDTPVTAYLSVCVCTLFNVSDCPRADAGLP